MNGPATFLRALAEKLRDVEGRNRVDRRILTSPLYLAARDVATRAGVAEGLLLAPEHADKAAEIPADRSLISNGGTAALFIGNIAHKASASFSASPTFRIHVSFRRPAGGSWNRPGSSDRT